jgi:hypothetical protein
VNGYCTLLLALWPAASLAAGTEAYPDSSRTSQAHRRIVFQLDQRFSQLQRQLIGINGVKLGVEWRNRLRTGVGLYVLSSGLRANAPQPFPLPAGTTNRVRFRYATLYGEYVLIGTPRWELSTPVQVGWGRYHIRYDYPDGNTYRTPRRNLGLIEPAVTGHMRIFQWVGLGAGVGYRQVLFTPDKLENDLSGIIFSGRLKLFLGDLYKVAHGRQRLFTQQGLRRGDPQP